jgi:hypothetical protein
MPNPSLTCDYCASHNPIGETRCVACGAPLPLPSPPVTKITRVETPITPPPAFSTPAEPIGEELKKAAGAIGSTIGALSIGTYLLRTAAEAVAIAVSAFIIGLNAGSAPTNLHGNTLYFLLALGGGGLVGLCIGLVSKRVVWTLLSAPFGALLGTVAAIFLQLNQPRQPWMAIFALGGAVLLALLGSYRSSGGLIPCYQRLRPFLGLAGGLVFGLLGYAAGFKVY